MFKLSENVWTASNKIKNKKKKKHRDRNWTYSSPQALNSNIFGSKGWRSGESARLPPMWPGFKSRCRRHMWVEFVVGSLLCSKRFFFWYSANHIFSQSTALLFLLFCFLVFFIMFFFICPFLNLLFLFFFSFFTLYLK